MGKIISFFNHKGGVGKTTLVHNIGTLIAESGKSVLLIDADPQMNLTASIFGLSTSIEYSVDETSK
jgi:chromosome partitioning protein